MDRGGVRRPCRHRAGRGPDEGRAEGPAAAWTATNEGRPGAFWALLGPDVRLRRTDYDIRDAEAELRGGGWPGVDDFLCNSLLEPADPLAIAESLERQARER